MQQHLLEKCQNQLKTLKAPTKTCKVCFNPIYERSFYTLFNPYARLCNKCIKKFKGKLHVFHVYSYKAYSIYKYDENIRSLLYQLKGCGDIELANLFLYNYKTYLRLLFIPYYLVPAPSYYLSDEERGFNHVKEIFKALNLPFLDLFEKVEKHKQSNQKGKERRKINNYLRLKKDSDLSGKKILIVDDVFTTGSTVKTMIRKLEKLHPKDIKILVMCRTIYKEKKSLA